MRFDDSAQTFTVTLKKGPATQVLTVAPPSYRVTKSVVTGIDAYDLQFENIEAVGPATYPRRVTLTSARAQLKLELNYKDVAVNEPPDLTLYEISAPANVPSVELDEHGIPRDADAAK
jgi:hypothetical protein